MDLVIVVTIIAAVVDVDAVMIIAVVAETVTAVAMVTVVAVDTHHCSYSCLCVNADTLTVGLDLLDAAVVCPVVVLLL